MKHGQQTSHAQHNLIEIIYLKLTVQCPKYDQNVVSNSISFIFNFYNKSLLGNPCGQLLSGIVLTRFSYVERGNSLT